MPLIAILVALSITSCGESRQVNPGAHTAWIDCTADDLERFVPAGEKVGTNGHGFVERFALGYCLGDGSAVYVWSKAPTWVGEHEFCHLVDVFHGDWVAARASIGAGAPAAVDELCAALSHAKRAPGYQWAVLHERHPLDQVIVHPEKVALVAALTHPH